MLVAIGAEEAAAAKQETPVARTHVKDSLAVCVDNWLANHNKLLVWHCDMYFLFHNVFSRVAGDICHV